MKCPRCQHENPREANFCLKCAMPLKGASPADPNLSGEVEVLRQALSEALDQQTATSEILRVIASSPTDTQPVLDVVAENAARVCDATDAAIWRADGEHLQSVAHYGPVPLVQHHRLLNRGWPTGRAVVDRKTIHVHDIAAELETEFPEAKPRQLLSGARTVLATPLLREGVPIGAIQIRRQEVRPFSDKQIELLQTFADQAVIAIENVRLFTELQEKNRALTQAHAQVSETLEQRTATAEILRVISGSPTDVQPVFDTIVRSAVRLCDGLFSSLYQFDGERIHQVAQHNYTPEALEELHRVFPARPSRALFTGRAILARAVVHIPDREVDPEHQHQSLARAIGWRSGLFVPMLREGVPIGVIEVARSEPGPFSDNEIELLKTFADQAVIAIENVRLFTELQERNRAVTQAHAQVTEALEQQTATSEILRVISSSPTNIHPVFSAIVESAVRLCGARFGAVFRFDGERVHLAAHHNLTPENLQVLQRLYPMRPSRDQGSGRAILAGATVRIEDALSDPEYRHEVASAGGWRSMLAVPMLREGSVVGTINVHRTEAGPFPERQIELLKIFADQAVIAIENVRLFKELEARNRDLTATGEVLQVISRSPTDVQPVFDTIARNARRLCNADSGGVVRLEGGLLHLQALDNASAEGAEALRRAYPNPVSSGTGSGRAILTGRAVRIPDVLEDPEYELAGLQGAGLRSVLCVPMLLHGTAIGVIAVHTWATPRPFTDQQMELLKTFADQAVIAIENVRLFKELQTRTAELTRSVDQLTALGEVGRAVSSTLDLETVLTTIVSHAVQLSGPVAGAIYEYDEAAEEFQLRATENFEAEYVELLRAMPIRKGEGALGRVAMTQQPVQIPDFTQERTYQSRFRDALTRLGYRALLAVPLLREDHIIGGLVINGKTPGEFAPEVIDLLKTFASQSALAIQNARLFREIEDKGRQLEAASRHKSEFLANMSHELRTPLNAITGFSEVLLERMFGEINPKQTEYLQDILSSGRHLLSLINDILDLSKIEAGRMELSLAQFHLPLALENAITLVKERAARHGIALDIDIDPGLGEFMGDERKIKQILLNLLSNAVKFTPEGGRIGVKAGRADGVVEIAVSDTGIGIAPKDQEAIFEEFRQVGSDEARKVEGTGLGLTLTKKFVEMHGGRIWVESEVGKGSTFRFTLPSK